MFVTAVVVAAGKGARFKSRVPKPLCLLNKRPLIYYSLSALSKHRLIDEIIVVVNKNNQQGIADCITKFGIPKVSSLVTGGRQRQDSVRNGLEAADSGADFVLIHDAARPFITAKLVFALLKDARRSGAAIAGVPVKATIKRAVRFRVKNTVPRQGLWEIQTPQAFKKELLLAAFRKYGRTAVTDDAMLVEKLGKRVTLVQGEYTNIKITTADDLIIAEAIAKRI